MSGLEPLSLVGEEISDRIRVTKLLAVGWVGYVYRGEVLSLGRPIADCAVKLLRPRSMCSPDSLLQDLCEQGRFIHPHLLALQHSGLVKNRLARDWIYLSWELADYSIQDFLTRGQTLTPIQVRECLLQVLEALRYLHVQGIVHGDIRPSNILSTTTGWRLSGLEHHGILSRRLEELGYNQTHFVFRAPEAQERGAEHGAADIWSLAVVAHAALTCRLPFDEEQARDSADLLWRIIHQDPVIEDFEEPFASFMAHCLLREPGRRWTAEQALACLSGRPVLETYFQQIGADRPEQIESEEPDPEPLVAAVPPAPPATSPLYVGLCLALLLIGLFIGKFLLPAPARKVVQVHVDELVNQEYSVATLDERGRISLQSALAPVLREEIAQGGVHLDLVQIPQADFDMGAPETLAQREFDEGPRHRVRLSNFYMGRFEVTQAQWSAVAQMPIEGKDLPLLVWTRAGADLPVETVSWSDANEFCRRLTRYTGKFHRLPTEAEWEYACRGGPIDTPFHFGPLLTDQVANFNPDPPFTQSLPIGLNRNQVISVEAFPYANPFGLFQMHGNVREWCQDFYAPYSPDFQENPQGPNRGDERVLRGGSFRSPAVNCRTSARAHDAPDRGALGTGFRVVIPEIVSFRETL